MSGGEREGTRSRSREARERGPRGRSFYWSAGMSRSRADYDGRRVGAHLNDSLSASKNSSSEDMSDSESPAVIAPSCDRSARVHARRAISARVLSVTDIQKKCK